MLDLMSSQHMIIGMMLLLYIEQTFITLFINWICQM